MNILEFSTSFSRDMSLGHMRHIMRDSMCAFFEMQKMSTLIPKEEEIITEIIRMFVSITQCISNNDAANRAIKFYSKEIMSILSK